MLFPLPGKCHFLKEALLRPPPTPSLGLSPVHLPMTQEAAHSYNFTLTLVTIRAACVPLAPLVELCENSGLCYPCIAYGACYLAALNKHLGGWSWCDTIWCCEVPGQCGPRPKQNPGTLTLFSVA